VTTIGRRDGISDPRLDPDSRPADPCVALRVTRTLSVGPGGAFEGGGDRRADLAALVNVPVAAEEAGAREVADDRAGDRDRDDRDLAPKATAVARLLRRGGRAGGRGSSPVLCSIRHRLMIVTRIIEER
jgi:hypothetical protein